MPISFHLGEVATQLCYLCLPLFPVRSLTMPIRKVLAKSKCKSNRATMTRLISQVELRPSGKSQARFSRPFAMLPCCQFPVPDALPLLLHSLALLSL